MSQSEALRLTCERFQTSAVIFAAVEGFLNLVINIFQEREVLRCLPRISVEMLPTSWMWLVTTV